jgi:predicted enzyme related to lactoylglutathione lyase
MFSNFQVNTIVDDVEPLVAFYKSLGFEETYRVPKEGPADHVEVRAIGLILGISSRVAAREHHDLEVARGNAVQVCLWCDDVDAALEKMLQAGARVAREPRDFQDGRLRNCWVYDPAGNLVDLVHERW